MTATAVSNLLSTLVNRDVDQALIQMAGSIDGLTAQIAGIPAGAVSPSSSSAGEAEKAEGAASTV